MTGHLGTLLLTLAKESLFQVCSQYHPPTTGSQTHPSVTLAWDSGYPRVKFYCPRRRNRKGTSQSKAAATGQEVSILDLGPEGLSMGRERAREKKGWALTSLHERNTESLWGEAATRVTCPEWAVKERERETWQRGWRQYHQAAGTPWRGNREGVRNRPCLIMQFNKLHEILDQTKPKKKGWWSCKT